MLKNLLWCTHMTEIHGKEEKIFQYTGEPITETQECNDCENCKKRKLSESEIIERVRKLGEAT